MSENDETHSRSNLPGLDALSFGLLLESGDLVSGDLPALTLELDACVWYVRIFDVFPAASSLCAISALLGLM